MTDGAEIVVTSSFSWDDELTIDYTVTLRSTTSAVLDRGDGGRFFTIQDGGNLIAIGLTFKDGKVSILTCCGNSG